MISFVFPILLSVSLILLNGILFDIKKYKNNIMYYFIVVLLGITLMSFFISIYSVYDAVFFECIYVFFIYNLLLLFIRKYNKKRIVLSIVVEIIIAILVRGILTYGQAHINSDTATVSLLTNSILENKSLFPKTWNYANGEIWFLGLLTNCFPFLISIGNKVIARLMGSVFSLIITVLSIRYLTRKLFNNDSWLFAIPLIFLFIILDPTITNTDTVLVEDVLLYQSAYTPQLTCISLSLVWAYSFFCKNDCMKGFLLSFLLVGLSIGGIRYFAELIIPIFISISFMLVYEHKKSRTKINISQHIYKSILIFISGFIGVLINRLLQIGRNVNNISTDIKFNFIGNIKKYIINYFYLFGCDIKHITSSYINIFYFVIALLILILPFILIVNNKKKINNQKLFYFIFFVSHNVILFLAIIVFGFTTPHYLITSLFFIILFFSNNIYEYIMDNKKFSDTLLIIMIILFVIYSSRYISKTYKWKDDANSKYEISDILVKNNISKIYGNYWDTYLFEIYSNYKVRGAAIESVRYKIEDDYYLDRLKPYLWLVDSNVYSFDKTIRTAYIYRKSKQSENLEVFGNPIDIKEINNYIIYIYDTDIVSFLYNGLEDGIIDNNELFYSKDGVKRESNRLIIKPYGYTLGPYISLEKGKYLIIEHGDNLELSNFNISSFTDNDSISYEVIEKTDKYRKIYMFLDKNVENIEFTAYNPGDTENIYLDNIEIAKIDE